MLGSIAEYIAASNIATVGDVIRVMKEIGECVPKDRGVGAFNWLYLTVTEEGERRTKDKHSLSDAWLLNLDVAFAKLYFDAIVQWGKPSKRWRTPRAWRTIFDAHHDSHIQPVQFAVAGLLTHITVDLPVAVAQVSRDPKVFKDDSNEHKDFLQRNPILYDAEIRALRALGSYIVREVAFPRDGAWEHGKEIASYPKNIHDPKSLDLIHKLDRETEWLLNHFILKPTGFMV